MEITKKQPSTFGPRIQRAFLVLGIDLFKRSPKNTFQQKRNRKIPKFWQRDDLQYILVDAKRAYISSIKQNHPDLRGSHNRTVEINKAWEFIERRFKEKGFQLN